MSTNPPPAASDTRRPLEVRPADLTLTADQQATLELLDQYARHPMGMGRPLAEPIRAALVPRLHQHPTTHVLLAWEGATAIGILVAVLGFSTFSARPLLNVHDLFVRREWQGTGVGGRLLREAEAMARRLDCCKLTLEVRSDNFAGKRLYRRVGFDPGVSGMDAMEFWTKLL